MRLNTITVPDDLPSDNSFIASTTIAVTNPQTVTNVVVSAVTWLVIPSGSVATDPNYLTWPAP